MRNGKEAYATTDHVLIQFTASSLTEYTIGNKGQGVSYTLHRGLQHPRLPLLVTP